MKPVGLKRQWERMRREGSELRLGKYLVSPISTKRGVRVYAAILPRAGTASVIFETAKPLGGLPLNRSFEFPGVAWRVARFAELPSTRQCVILTAESEFLEDTLQWVVTVLIGWLREGMSSRDLLSYFTVNMLGPASDGPTVTEAQLAQLFAELAVIDSNYCSTPDTVDAWIAADHQADGVKGLLFPKCVVEVTACVAERHDTPTVREIRDRDFGGLPRFLLCQQFQPVNVVTYSVPRRVVAVASRLDGTPQFHRYFEHLSSRGYHQRDGSKYYSCFTPGELSAFAIPAGFSFGNDAVPQGLPLQSLRAFRIPLLQVFEHCQPRP